MAVVDGVRKQLDWLREQGYLTDSNAALEDIALNLARTLDGGAGLAQAAVANQLRGTLAEIAKVKSDDDDEFSEFLSGLGTPSTSPLGNSKNT